MADALKERVASGEYASESEVVRDGLRALFAQEEAVEAWLRTEVVSAYDELRSDPSLAISARDMRARLVGMRTPRADHGS
ncbi:MAG: type II toxin-antitoxin system ParD family antitoxin [Micrococcales bacterium]|nr:type II toxin-antitoxin system ParD family antitoxin [Micrococcales bacterium]